MKITLDIENKTSKSLPSVRTIKNAILSILKEKKMTGAYEIGLKIVSPEAIKKLNSKYRNKNMTTDVLSFPIYAKAPRPSGSVILLGDIVICPDIMAENAEMYGVKPQDEFIKLISHSVLHLLGFHHS